MNTQRNHILLIDAGNSRIKWALGVTITPAHPHNIEAQGTVTQGDWAELEAQWAGLHGVQHVWLCSVAGAACEQGLRHSVQKKFGTIPFSLVQSQAQQAGVTNQYTVPATLGSDRWMMALAAHHLYPHQHVLIVSAGTATTIDAMDAHGHFLGGVIIPGLQLMQQALAQRTAQLPLVPVVSVAASASTADLPENHSDHGTGFAHNTQDAIASGCLQAQLGAIERMYQQLQQHGFPHDALATLHAVAILLTGGAASHLAWHLQYPVHLHKNLVLTGLNLVAQPTSSAYPQ